MKKLIISIMSMMLAVTLTACSSSTTTETAENYNTNLPVININTEDSIAITSKDKYINATASITGNDTYDDQYSGDIKIRGRGNSSWNEFPKKGYKIKLDDKTDLFGMGESKEWALLPDYLDECFMRTKFNTGLAKDMDMLYMSGEWVVLFINNEYRGVYELSESVGISKNRVNIFDWEEEAENIAEAICDANSQTLSDEDKEYMSEEMIETLSFMTTGTVTYKDKTYKISDYYKMNTNLNEGYLFELSEEYDETSRFKTDLSHYNIMIKSPEYLAYNEDAMNNAKKIWNKFDEAIHSKDGKASDGTYYTDIVNLQSLVDYWLISEFSVNGEAVKKSRYAYIGEDGKITFGPVWDFDYTLDPSKKTLTDWGWTSEVGDFDDTKGWKICTSDNSQNIFNALIKHDDFLNLAYARYNNVMKASIQSNKKKLSTYYDYLLDEGLKNEKKWQFDRGFKEDYKTVTDFINNRYKWMNETFKDQKTFINSFK